MEQKKFYRAKLSLEEVEPYTDCNGYRREHTADLAELTVTGDTPGDAMTQIHDHAGTLYEWHDQPAPAVDEAFPALVLGDLPARIRSAFEGVRAEFSPAGRAAEANQDSDGELEPDTVKFHASDYADKLTFDATPSWLTEALESGVVTGVFKGEDYWYLEVKTPAGVVTAEPGDTIHRHFDGGLLVRSPEGLCKKIERQDSDGETTACPCDQFCPDGERCDGLTTQEAVAQLNAEQRADEADDLDQAGTKPAAEGQKPACSGNCDVDNDIQDPWCPVHGNKRITVPPATSRPGYGHTAA